MRGILRVAAGLLGPWCVLAAPGAAQVFSVPQHALAAANDWPTERVELIDGRVLQGLIESEDDVWLNLIEIQRRWAQPMYLVIRPIDRASIAATARLDPGERARLRHRIEQFINRVQIEAGKMEAVRLELAEREGLTHHLYRGRWFLLDSTTDEATTRRIIVRLEQVFTAYRQILPPKTTPQEPLRLVVLGSAEEYHAYLERFGLEIGNRAVFFQEQNLVVAGSELGRYAALLAKVKARHAELLDELQGLEKQLPKRLEEIGRELQKQGKSRIEISRLLNREKRNFQRLISQKELEIKRCERQNDEVFNDVAGQMLARLYHEAFHAYLENYVYPRGTHHVPHWLNEGLAMVFEEGRLESGSLRLDAPNRTALQKLKDDLAGRQPLPLARLLAADGRDFLVAHNASSEASNRLYSYAWGLVYYLTFEKRLLDNPALDRYVTGNAEGVPPVERFERLAATPLPVFEDLWRQYVRELK